MSENTPNNPSQGAAGGYGYDAGARPAQDASLPGQAAQPGNATQATQPSQPMQSSQPVPLSRVSPARQPMRRAHRIRQ